MRRARAQAILVDPVREWAAIENEPGDPAYVLSRYVTVLALVPAVFSFIGACVGRRGACRASGSCARRSSTACSARFWATS